MAIIHRLSRLFTADFHALLDRIEEPETLLKQAIREMEQTIEEDEAAAAALVNGLRQGQVESGRLDRRLGEVTEHLEMAFTAGNDHLAKQLIRQRLELERQGTALSDRTDDLQQSRQLHLQRLAENHAALDAIRQKLASVETPGHSPDSVVGVERVTEQDVEAAFLAEQRRRVAS